MRLTRQGISFRYHDDILLWIWPWARTGHTFWSSMTDSGFKNLRDYWVYMGAIHTNLRTHRLKGFSGLDLAKEKARLESKFGPVLLIYNLEPINKPISFWNKLGRSKSMELNSEFCLLFPDSREEAISIMNTLPSDFADVDLYDGGVGLLKNTPED